MLTIVGKQSITFQEPPFIMASASVVGKKEGEGPLSSYFDKICKDDMMGQDSWELAESELQRQAANLAIEKADLQPEQIRSLFAGDLLGQSMASSFGTSSLSIPFFGVYGACSTAGEAISLAAVMVAADGADYSMAVTSSHFCSAEKQFRFPLAYGNQRPLSATWTVTGSAAFIIAKKIGLVKITGITTGKIVDYGVKDPMNMGACMAPAASDTIYCHLCDFNRKPEDYDKIITGDLGYVGQEILFRLLLEKGIDIRSVHMDCGIEIFDKETQDTHSGGSGCGCAAVTLSAYIQKKLVDKEWHKVLFVPTGALLSKVSFNEGQTVPGIAHAVILETVE